MTKENTVIEGELIKKSAKIVEKENQVAVIEIEGLIKIPENSVVAAFSDEKKLNAFVRTIKKEVIKKVNDLKSDKGRKEIASRAHKVSKMKTALNKVLDTSLEDAKAQIKKAGEGKKYLILQLDSLKAEVRKPLTDWENAEKEKEEKRIEAIQELLKGISLIGNLTGNETKEDISELIEAITGIDCEQGFDEYAQDALQAKSSIKEKLSEKLNFMIQKELEDQQRKELAEKEAELELQRKASELKEQAQQRLNKLMMIPVGFMGKSAAEIEAKINSLKNYTIEENQFGELYESAKQSVLTVINQLQAMATNQKIVEQAQEQQAKQVEDLPFSEETDQQEGIIDNTPELKKVLDEVVPISKEEPVKERVFGGYTTSIPLTPHQEMMKKVDFWANDYGINTSALSDLNNILNQYK